MRDRDIGQPKVLSCLCPIWTTTGCKSKLTYSDVRYFNTNAKTLSKNMGHDHLATTRGDYMPSDRERPREVITALRDRV